MPRKSADMIVSVGISGAAPAGAASLLPTGDDMFAVSDLEARIRKLLADIEGQQSPAERLETAKALMALLDPTSDTYGGPAAVDAFLCGGGPSIMKYRLDSMDGDWMGEARLGVTDMIDKIARLPGLQRTFDKVAFIKEEHVLNARRELHEMAHSHGPDGECETTGSSRECGREDCNIVQRRVEKAFTTRAVETRPGDAPQGTVHVVELHQQLKSVIEK